MPGKGGRRKIAIACQGGGSHTAFTAGVLQRLLAEDVQESYELVGLSGTSGGAVCAALSWYGLIHDDVEPGGLLRDFWVDLSARTLSDRTANAMVQWGTRMRTVGFSMPEASPYWTPASVWGQRELGDLLEQHLEFSAIPDLIGDGTPALLISAIDVLSGEFKVFREHELSTEVILASAAEPSLFNAVEVDGRMYWDGLFSKNPPVRDFNIIDDFPDPDEIWLIKINPQERFRVPTSLNGILDRRSELSGNLSLNAEISFISQVNRWIEQGYLPPRYTHTDVHRIRFRRNLDWTTKLDRSPEFLGRLLRDGRERADEFLETR